MRILDSHGVLYQYTKKPGLRFVDGFTYTNEQSDVFLENFIEQYTPPNKWKNIHKNAIDYMTDYITHKDKLSDYLFIEYLLLNDLVNNKKDVVGIEIINKIKDDMDSVIVSSAHIKHSEIIKNLLEDNLRIKNTYYINPKNVENWKMAFSWIFDDYDKDISEVIDDKYAESAYEAAKEMGFEIKIFTSL